jgi:hypothetical protein
MALLLEIVAGPGAGTRYSVEPGQTLTLGRSESADISCPSDTLLSPLHCSFECADRTWIVRELQSGGGTFVNGERITVAELRAGDSITAGVFLLTPVLDGGPAAPRTSLLNYFRSLSEPLFCLLDAACGQQVFQLIQDEIRSATPARIQCLYDGNSAQELAAFAPYLVQLAPDSSMLEGLLHKGWGKGWASYFVSRSSFEDLRHHFRKFLLVKLDSDEEAYFRFYDPRVLTVFLPTCNARELGDFFGPVGAWMIETKDPETLSQLTNEHGGLTAVEIKLTRQ